MSVEIWTSIHHRNERGYHIIPIFFLRISLKSLPWNDGDLQVIYKRFQGDCANISGITNYLLLWGDSAVVNEVQLTL